MALQIEQSELGRLLGRGPWEDDVDSFSQELVALLPSLFKELPVAKLEGVATDSSPSPIKIEDQTTDGQIPIFSITRGPTTFDITLNPLTGALTSSAPNQPKKTTPTAGAGLIGVIMAYLGANEYTVNVYPNGVAGDPVEVTATQLNGNPLYPHLADGTVSAFVTKSGGLYYLDRPVWG